MGCKFFVIALIAVFYLPLSAQQVTTNPHGKSMKISCETCHTTADWNKIPGWKFNHDQTGFTLLGAHKDLQCRDCHQSLVFNQVGISCIDCHTDIHKGELGNQCENCHNSRSWENRRAIYEQHNQTNFPLLGVHANLDCESCHSNEQQNQFTLSVECQSCHLNDYMKTLNPSHQKANFDLDCQKCHGQLASKWESARFEHPQTFLLEGGHKNVECIACHNTGYSHTSEECNSCHQPDYQKATNPNHAMFGFPTVCEECHDIMTWQRTDFDHFSVSAFQIEGAHLNILCIDCHVNNQLKGLPRDCAGCHQNDFNTAPNPNHVQLNFSTNCLDCHNINAWQPAEFDHSTTQFPLTDGHKGINCMDCHKVDFNTPLSSACFSCHEQDFNQVADPNHVSSNFDHDCTICHNTSAFKPATFDHNNTQFPLVGKHSEINCIQCHASGYQNTSMLCVTCHQNDYDNTSDPNHTSAQFPNTCEDCHTSFKWKPATWDHDGQYFPIYTGKHSQAWNSCADCHINPANYVQFECINCHEHSQANTDGHHREVRDYEYLSSRCYDCHPDGRVHD